MRKVLYAVVALSLGASSAFAGAAPGDWALGFVRSDAPIGGRYQINEKIGLDAGLGFGDVEDVGSTLSLNVGLPINMKSGDRAEMNLRPGLFFSNASSDIEGVDDESSVEISAYLEFQVWLSNNLSVNAGPGLRIETDPTVIQFAGAEVFSAGFHYWVK